MSTIGIDLHPAGRPDEARAWCLAQSSTFGGPVVAGIETVHALDRLDALVASDESGRCGFAHIARQGSAVEIVTILAMHRQQGVGTLLLDQIERFARAARAVVLIVQTTNDNTDALRFYQRRGFRVSDYRVGGFRDALRRKGVPANQPVEGQHGIEIRDLIRLSKVL